jgi:hypothetical protein
MSDTNFGEWAGGDRRSEWDGTERRGGPIPSDGHVPVALLRYLDARMDAKFARIESKLDAHTVEEMTRYSQILDRVDDGNKASEARHLTVVGQLATLNTKADSVESAFISDEKGKPDFSGHRNDHRSRKVWGDWLDSTKRGTAAEMIKWLGVFLLAVFVVKVAPGMLMQIIAPGAGM